VPIVEKFWEPETPETFGAYIGPYRASLLISKILQPFFWLQYRMAYTVLKLSSKIESTGLISFVKRLIEFEYTFSRFK
jgi:hypothetical protein